MVLWFNGKVVGVYTKGPWFNSWREQPVLFFFSTKKTKLCGHAPSLRTQERGIRLVSSALAKLRMFLTTQFFQNQDFVYKNSIDHDTDLAKFSLFWKIRKVLLRPRVDRALFIFFRKSAQKSSVKARKCITQENCSRPGSEPGTSWGHAHDLNH